MHSLTRASFGALCTLALFVGPSCSSSQSAKTTETATAPSAQDAAAPLPGSSAVLIVHGMSCPKCANNIHVSLDEVAGVSDSTVDLATGRVTVQFDPLAKTNPSRAELTRVIKNSGFTLVDIQTN